MTLPSAKYCALLIVGSLTASCSDSDDFSYSGTELKSGVFSIGDGRLLSSIYNGDTAVIVFDYDDEAYLSYIGTSKKDFDVKYDDAFSLTDTRQDGISEVWSDFSFTDDGYITSCKRALSNDSLGYELSETYTMTYSSGRLSSILSTGSGTRTNDGEPQSFETQEVINLYWDSDNIYQTTYTGYERNDDTYDYDSYTFKFGYDNAETNLYTQYPMSISATFVNFEYFSLVGLLGIGPAQLPTTYSKCHGTVTAEGTVDFTLNSNGTIAAESTWANWEFSYN